MTMSKYSVEIQNFTEILESIVSVYLTNKLIFSYKFGALTHIYKLSSSGKYLVVATANSKHEDSGKVFIFDLEDKKLLFSGELKIGCISELFFLGDAEDLYATNHFGSYEVDKNGKVVELEKVHYDAIMGADTYSIDFIEPYLEDNGYSECAIRQVVYSLDRIIDDQFNQFHGVSWAATALRKRGEYLEMLGEKDEAFLNYVDAIYLNPKIGVKRKLTILSNKMGLNLEEFRPSMRALKIEESCRMHREISMAKSEASWESISNNDDVTVEFNDLLVQVKPSEKFESIPKLIKNNKDIRNKNRNIYLSLRSLFRSVFLIPRYIARMTSGIFNLTIKLLCWRNK